MSSFCKCKSYSHFFNKNISIYAIFNDQIFNDMLINDMISFEQLGLDTKHTKQVVNSAVLVWLKEKVLEYSGVNMIQ